MESGAPGLVPHFYPCASAHPAEALKAPRPAEQMVPALLPPCLPAALHGLQLDRRASAHREKSAVLVRIFLELSLDAGDERMRLADFERLFLPRHLAAGQQITHERKQQAGRAHPNPAVEHANATLVRARGACHAVGNQTMRLLVPV